MSTTTPPDGGVPNEIGFSGGTRGKFYRLGATLNLPVYLNAEVQDHLARLANAKGVGFSNLVNAMLRKTSNSSISRSSIDALANQQCEACVNKSDPFFTPAPRDGTREIPRRSAPK